MDRFSIFLDVLAAIILAGAVALLFTFALSNIGNVSIEKNIIALTIEPIQKSDKNTKYYKLNINEFEKIEQVLADINKNTKRLELAKDGVYKSLKAHEYKNVYSVLVAIILAVAGFFGFKSIHDIKRQSIVKAKEASKETARNVSRNTAKDVSKEYLEGPFYTEVIQKAMEVTDPDITSLKEGLNRLNDILDEHINAEAYSPQMNDGQGCEAQPEEAQPEEAQPEEAQPGEAPSEEAPRSPRRRANPFKDSEGK